jgi:hypothetical protein
MSFFFISTMNYYLKLPANGEAGACFAKRA